MPAIEVRDLRRTYTSTTGFFGQQRVAREALRGVSLEIPSGELFGLLGPNGAGKTTLVKILATVLLPTSGSVRVLDEDVVRKTGSVRRRIGLVFGGERGLYGTLTGRGTLRFWADLYRLEPRVAARRVDEVLDLVGLRERAGERVETYSRGMKQRLHLARGILHEPELLFLDEPTIGLDPVASAELRAIVRDLRHNGVTILLTTHYMAEAEALCDRVAFINEGRIIAIDTPQAFTRVAAEFVVLEVSMPHAAADNAQIALQRHPSNLQITTLPLQDGVRTLQIRAPRDVIGDVLGLVGQHHPSRVTTLEQTLEDVYLRLLGDRAMRV